MENNLQIGVVLKKRENIYTPEKTIYGYFKEEEKKLMDEKLNLLNTNKTYTLYLYYLNNVNNMIELIKDELNDYFYKVTNIL